MADEPRPGDAEGDPPSTGPQPASGESAAQPSPTSASPQSTEAVAVPKPKPKPKAPPEAPKGPTDPLPPDDLDRPAFLDGLEKAIPGALQQVSYWVGDWTVIVPVSALLDVATHLKESNDGSFDYCSDLTATDWPPREKRFDVVYCLYSTRRRHRLRVKVQVAEGESLPSVTGLWPAANWLEREVWDMFGVNFSGHPDLRRILMPDGWQGHPQRKDYPLEGPGEYLLESPMEWLRLRNLPDETEIE
ncbi:MAG: NADH-quinone oxidoreductase subunit C [Acidobacteriota bacterium]|nr:NADH-quinone oxidoreductase subunit C [Acidobacteriota bacterium]